MARTVLLAVAAAVLAAPGARAAAPYADSVLATPGLAGYWSLDEPTGPRAADLRTTGTGLHEGGVRTGTPPLTGAGASARYDGRHAATVVPNDPRLNPTRAVTVEAWVRTDALRHAATLAGKPGQYALGFTRDGAAVLRVWHRARVTRLASPPATVAAGRTTHLVATFDGRTLKIDADGRPRAKRALRARLDKQPSDLVLGGGLDGRLDDVAVYDRAVVRADRPVACAARPLPIGLAAWWRPPCWRPYRAGGPFDQPLRDDAPLAPDSRRIVARLAGQGAPQMIYGLPRATSDASLDPADFQHPLYTGDWLEAGARVRCTRYPCPELRRERVPLPDGARPAAAEDGHFAVLDDDSGAEYDLWQARLPSRASGGGFTSPADGLAWGLGSDATAAHFGLAAGVVRAPELAAGEIDHALFLLVNCTDGLVAPAQGLGAACDDGHGPPMGTRLRLAMSDREIAALDVPEWKRGVLRALARYGGYVGDTGASDDAAFEVAMESGETYTSLGGPDLIGDLWARVDGERRFDNYRYFDVGSGVDWRARLRVVDPCVAARSC